MLANVAGIAEVIYNDARWQLLYPLIGALCAYFGPGVNFIRFPDNEYIYLTPGFSFIAGAIWFSFFPFVFRYLDEISGLVGHVLAVSFVMMLAEGGAFFMSFAGLMLLFAFWSRFGNMYRQAGKALASMWGLIVAGTAIISSTKGIVLSTILFLSLGLFAIPVIEIAINFAKDLLSDTDDNKHGVGKIYSRMLDGGTEHPEAVQYLAGLCALTSIAAVWNKWLIILVVVIILFIFRRSRKKLSGNKPSLWDISFDNVSMNYAISKARGLIQNPPDERANLVVTLNAIGMETTIDDPEFFEIVKESAMILADGSGLCLGKKESPVLISPSNYAEQQVRKIGRFIS